MIALKHLLDADWKRLRILSGVELRSRSIWDAFSPRFAPVVLIRFAQHLHLRGWTRLAKFSALMNFILFGIEVPPRLPIGPGLVLMHTQGTVLGAATIGANVTLYHQVTLGARDLDFSYTLSLRPIVEDGVVIGAGAKVLGALTLGQDCMVGSNAVVLSDVPASYIAVGIPAKCILPKRLRMQGVIVDN
jgi:serine O-acetyltransferase